MDGFPLNSSERTREPITILNMNKNNGYDTSMILNLKFKVIKTKTHIENKTQRKWAFFTNSEYYISSITKFFRHPNTKIVYRTKNTIKDLLKTRKKQRTVVLAYRN
jgi:hypothetical protein